MGKLWNALPGKNPLVKLICLLVVAVLGLKVAQWVAGNPGSIGDGIYKFFTVYLPAAVDWFISLVKHAGGS